MASVLSAVVIFVANLFKSRGRLEAENLPVLSENFIRVANWRTEAESVHHQS